MTENSTIPEKPQPKRSISNKQKIDDLWKQIKKDPDEAELYENHLLKEVAFYAYYFCSETKTEIGRCLGVQRPTIARWLSEVENSIVLDEDLKTYVNKTIVKAEAIFQSLTRKGRYAEAWRVWKDLIELLQSFGKIHKEADRLAVAHTMSLQDFRESKERYDRERKS